jgi:hypothetical protein
VAGFVFGTSLSFEELIKANLASMAQNLCEMLLNSLGCRASPLTSKIVWC